MGLNEILSGLPDVKAIAAAREQRKAQERNDFLVLECVPVEALRIFRVDTLEFRSRAFVKPVRNRPIQKLVKATPIFRLQSFFGDARKPLPTLLLSVFEPAK
jgi:hypothetical protein